jgi:predicted RNA-binding protein Jag
MSNDKSSFSGRNVDVAVKNAAKALGIKPEDLRYEVLAGQLGGFALIKVADEKQAPAVELVEKLSGDDPEGAASAGDDDRPRHERSSEAREGGDRGERSDRGDDRGDRGDDRGDRGGERGERGGDRGPRGGDRGARGSDRGGDRGGRGGDRGGRGRDRDRGGRGGRDGRDGDRGRGPRRDADGDRGPRRGRPMADLPPLPSDAPSEVIMKVAAGVELSEIGEDAHEVIRDILTGMGYGMTVEMTEDEESITFDLHSGVYHDVLVANQLEILDAVEHLIDKIVNFDAEHRRRIHVDSQGIKATSDQNLGESARELAERAIAQNETFKMGPLDARSRRLIHVALRDMAGVTTRSEGEGAFRRVCIIPKD